MRNRPRAQRAWVVATALAAVAALGLVRSATALAIPPVCADAFGEQAVVGGDRSNALNGSSGSTDWIRTDGVMGQIWVDPTRTVRLDCLDTVEASTLRARMVDGGGNLTSASVEIGYEMVNNYTINCTSHCVTTSFAWFSRQIDTARHIDSSFRFPSILIALPACHLQSNDWPEFRVFNLSSTFWAPQVHCGSSGWENVYGNQSFDTGYTRAVALARVGRYGGAGTSLDETFKNLQASTGSWSQWSHTQCFGNTADNYKWGINKAASPQPAFDVFNANPNTDC